MKLAMHNKHGIPHFSSGARNIPKKPDFFLLSKNLLHFFKTCINIGFFLNDIGSGKNIY
jgi:hypothetical protein